jgi:hypothetical protein
MSSKIPQRPCDPTWHVWVLMLRLSISLVALTITLLHVCCGGVA